MLKAGDVVMMKSGGPRMTVQRLIGAQTEGGAGTNIIDNALRVHGYADGDPVCEWFEGTQLKNHAFKKEVLETVE